MSDGIAPRRAPTRRALVVGSVLAIAGRPWVARGQTAARFAAVAVDAGPLAARGGGSAADLIRRLMPGQLQAVFGDLVATGAPALPTLVARVDTVYLTGFADTPGGGNAFDHPMDSLSGAGLTVLRRQVQSETPLHVTLPPSYSGTWYLPDIDARRIESLSYQFAYWLRREMQL